jgi:hypothetical protein
MLRDSNMTQYEYYKDMAMLISNEAVAKDPESMANALYFYMKQHSENVKIDSEWSEMLKNIKMLLSGHFDWKMREIHKLLIKLQKLTQYMKKTT